MLYTPHKPTDKHTQQPEALCCLLYLVSWFQKTSRSTSSKTAGSRIAGPHVDLMFTAASGPVVAADALIFDMFCALCAVP